MRIRGIPLLGAWSADEAKQLTLILEPLPKAWLESNPYVKAFVRRPVLTDGPAGAPGHAMYDNSQIVVFDKGVYHGNQIDPEQFGRSIYHELAHALLRLHPGLLDTWVASTRGDGFVDQYARRSPDDDFADSFSEYFLHTDQVRKRFRRKAQFIEELRAHGAAEEKIAMGFMYAFADELAKTASGGLRSLGEAALKGVKTPIGKGLLGAGAAGGAGLAFGASKGRQQGFEQGSAGMDDGMRTAYTMGVRRGAQAMYQQIVSQMGGGAGAGGSQA